jgi:hypothetical protein
MFNYFKKTIGDEAEEFNEQFNICKLVVFTYLEYSFRGHLEKKDFKSAIPEGIGESTLAAEVLKYLLPIGNNKTSPDIEKLSKEERALIEHNIPGWADHIMQGADFAKLIIQTLRMHLTFKSYSEGNNEWLFHTEEGEKIGDLLQKYGHIDLDVPNPKAYSKKIKEWMRWADTINEDNYKEYFDF